MKKALIIIDIQNDYLYDKRLKKFNYDTNTVINNINNIINKYKEDSDIIYISHLIHNFPTNRLLFGYSIKGTIGAELYKDLNIVSNYKFNKYLPSAYSNNKFKAFMKENNYDEIYICGLDNCGCVYHTALSALKKEKKVYIIKEATFSCFNKEKVNKVNNKLKLLGINFI